MKNATTLTVLAITFLFLVLACGGGDPAPPEYQGNWTGSDGSTIYMQNDGKAGFKFNSKSVDGGGATFDEAEKTLTISLFGISHTWKIDKEPKDGEMTLDGIVYRKN
jgi:hypothetical protein